MSPMTAFPAVTGFLCGLSLFPIIALWSTSHQRRAFLKKEEQRIKNTTFILSGLISDEHLANHVKSLCHLERQGILHVLSGRRRGYLLFRGGDIIDAFFRNKSGIDGFREILSCRDGEYHFESRQVRQPNLIRKSIDQLLQEDNH